MIIRRFLAKKLGHPSGIFGRLLMKLLNKGNAGMNDFTFQQLDLLSGDAVLEIGFGGGYLLEKIIQSQLPSRQTKYHALTNFWLLCFRPTQIK